MKSTYNTHCEVLVRCKSKDGAIHYDVWALREVVQLLGTTLPSRCPVRAGGCGSPIRLHSASDKMVAHFEHIAANRECRFSHIYDGEIVPIDWSIYPLGLPPRR